MCAHKTDLENPDISADEFSINICIHIADICKGKDQ